jgi:hypothetical protein
MRTTAKPVIEALQVHILDEFEETAEYANANSSDEYKLTHEPYTALNMLKQQITAMEYGNRGTYKTALDWVEGGSALIGYDEQREFLANLLEETPEEAQRFSDDKVFRKYCHLVAREITKLVEGAK